MVTLSEQKFKNIEDWTSSHCVTRWILSPAVLAFFYGIFLFLYEIKFLRQIVPAIHPLLILWAGIIICYSIVIRQSWRNAPYWKWFVLFGISTIISVILNFRVDFVLSIKAWVMTVFPVALFYISFFQYEPKHRKAVFLNVMLGAAIVVFVASAIALVMFLMRYSGIVSFMGTEQYLGIRLYDESSASNAIILYGIYADTNHAAVYAAIFMFYSIMLFFECRKGICSHHWQNVLGQVFAVLNFIMQICYFPLANSRGGWISLWITLFITAFLYLFCVLLKKHTKFFRILGTLAGTVLCIVIVSFALLGVRTVLSEMSFAIDQHFTTQQTEITDNADQYDVGEREKGSGKSSSVQLELPEEQNVDEFSKENIDFGSGRLGIWKEALYLFSKYPVFGICPGNSAYYASLYFDGGYLIYGKAIHNSYLDLLLDYGFVGFILLIMFFALCAKKVLSYLFASNDQINIVSLFSLSIVSMSLCSAVLLSCMFINTTAMYFVVLLATGYLVSLTVRKS